MIWICPPLLFTSIQAYITSNIVSITILINHSVCLQAFSANYWVRLGARPDMLNIGLPFYGRSFSLQDPSKSGVGAAAKGGGAAGRFTQEEGYLAFYEVSTTVN